MSEIADRIMLIGKWHSKGKMGGSIMYRASCSCIDSDHDITIDMEYDPEFLILDLNFYKKVYFFDLEMDPKNPIEWVKNIFHRLKKAVKLVFSGTLEMEETFLFQGEDHINGFIEALTKGRDYLLEDIRKSQGE